MVTLQKRLTPVLLLSKQDLRYWLVAMVVFRLSGAVGYLLRTSMEKIRLHKVKVLRMNAKGQQDTYVLSMQDAEALTKSPAYFVEQNDVIYVQPNNYRKRQSANANDTTNGSFWISVVSVLTTIAVLVFK